jgi:Bacterial extracellular solute-binding protein
VGTFPENSHPRILYPVTLTASAKPEARKFVEFLLSAEAAPAFEAQGFSSREKSARRRAECDAGTRGAPSTSLDIIWPLSLGYLPPGCRHFIHRRHQFLPF